ncbi:MAG: ShlB/FhaC/HecB family hemolysin secretion/activation protein [Cyanobacteria bacterium P01_E01_bin.48]
MIDLSRLLQMHLSRTFFTCIQISLMGASAVVVHHASGFAQTPDLTPGQLQELFPPEPRLPEDLPPPPPPLPAPEDLLQPTPETPPSQPLPPDIPETITVREFDVVGSTIFSAEELAELTRPFVGRPIVLAELFQARTAISQHYIRQGYINYGAFIPPQTLKDGVVRIRIVEGGLTGIDVSGTGRLHPNYVRQRLAIAGRTPLNRDRLLAALQLLQQDPRIESVAAELSASPEPGLSVLSVRVVPADTLRLALQTDNRRVSSAGSFERGLEFEQTNLLGGGDSLDLAYFNSDGSDEVNVSYDIPLGPRDTTLGLRFRSFASEVIESPENILDITSQAQAYELTLRHPLVKTPTEELAMGLTFSRQASRNLLGGANFLETADSQGRTRISAMRWFQEWVKRGDRQAFAARSQFSLGVEWFDATDNSARGGPDSSFFAWRGQAEWARQVTDNALLFVRADVQLADRDLLALEEFALGGARSVRGYPQNALLGDNGISASAEMRWSVYRDPASGGTLSIGPFVDVGTVWNDDGSLPNTSNNDNTLIGTGVGLQWEQSDRLFLRLDWGIPLTSIGRSRRTWQDNGLYFTMSYAPF